jgi:hypothetical protein
MLYLALGAAALALYFWVMGRGPLLKQRGWRVAAGAAALAAFTGAAWAGVRGSWSAVVALVVLGLWFAATARKPAGSPRAAPPPPSATMSADEARRILGVQPGASKEEIQAAYARLMRAVHPDVGGTTGLAAQLNAARDTLLK